MITDGHVFEIIMDSPSKELLSELRKLPGITSVEHHDHSRVITVIAKHKERTFYKLSDLLHKKRIEVEEIKLKEPSLEDVFIQLTKKDLRD